MKQYLVLTALLAVLLALLPLLTLAIEQITVT